MTWTRGEDLQEISFPYLIIEGNQSLTVWHSKVACCQPKPPKLTIYHWIKTELSSATLFQLKDYRTPKEQTKKHKARQENTEAQKRWGDLPTTSEQEIPHRPLRSVLQTPPLSKVQAGNRDKPSWVALVTGTKHLQEQFLYKKWFRRLPAIRKSFKKIFLESLS